MTTVPLQIPSPVVCSHLDDLLSLLQKKITNLDDVLRMCIREHLGPGGSCPLSAYNYALLSKTTMGIKNRITPSHNGFRAPKQFAKQASRQLFVQKFSCKAPVYQNCKIYANDGRLLCYCDQRKLQWLDDSVVFSLIYFIFSCELNIVSARYLHFIQVC